MKPSERKKARHYAMQAIYQWQMTGASASEIDAQFLEESDFANIDHDYFLLLLKGVIEHCTALDAAFEPYLDRSLEKLGFSEKAILRLGTFELAHCIDVPYKVAINESVELTKKFGATDSFKYINSILDKVARDLRKLELRSHG